MQRRQRQHLLHVDIGGAGNLPHPVRDLLRDEVVALHVGAGDLNVDGRRQSEVQDLRHDVGRLEEELHSRKAARQFLAQRADVSRRGVVMFRIQSHQDFRVAGADHAGIAIGEIEARIGQPNIVEDRHQFIFGDLLVQVFLNLIAEPGGLFHAQSGTGPHVQPHQAGIHRREEVLAQEEHQSHRQNAKRQKARSEHLAMSEGGFQKLVIAAAKLLETGLEPALVAPEDCLGPVRPVLMAAHDVHHQRRNQRSRQEVRGQHGEHHGFGQRHEQKPRHAR